MHFNKLSCDTNVVGWRIKLWVLKQVYYIKVQENPIVKKAITWSFFFFYLDFLFSCFLARIIIPHHTNPPNAIQHLMELMFHRTHFEKCHPRSVFSVFMVHQNPLRGFGKIKISCFTFRVSDSVELGLRPEWLHS